MTTAINFKELAETTFEKYDFSDLDNAGIDTEGFYGDEIKIFENWEVNDSSEVVARMIELLSGTEDSETLENIFGHTVEDLIEGDEDAINDWCRTAYRDVSESEAYAYIEGLRETEVDRQIEIRKKINKHLEAFSSKITDWLKGAEIAHISQFGTIYVSYKFLKIRIANHHVAAGRGGFNEATGVFYDEADIDLVIADADYEGEIENDADYLFETPNKESVRAQVAQILKDAK